MKATFPFDTATYVLDVWSVIPPWPDMTAVLLFKLGVSELPVSLMTTNCTPFCMLAGSVTEPLPVT